MSPRVVLLSSLYLSLCQAQLVYLTMHLVVNLYFHLIFTYSDMLRKKPNENMQKKNCRYLSKTLWAQSLVFRPPILEICSTCWNKSIINLTVTSQRNLTVCECTVLFYSKLSITLRLVKPTRVSKACAFERLCSCNSKSSMVSILSIWTAEEAGCVSLRRWRMSTSRLRTFFWNTEINKHVDANNAPIRMARLASSIIFCNQLQCLLLVQQCWRKKQKSKEI